MAYATLQDIIDRTRFDDFLLVAESETDPDKLDERAVSDALDDASGEMDIYIAKRYPLPLAIVPNILQRCCIDIALYQIGLNAHGNTEEKRQRYEDVIRLLKSIAKGGVELNLIPINEEATSTTTPSPPDAEITFSDRRFCRSSMRNLL